MGFLFRGVYRYDCYPSQNTENQCQIQVTFVTVFFFLIIQTWVYLTAAILRNLMYQP